MLFSTTKIVIYISRTKIVVSDCRTLPPTFFELNYNGSLLEAFANIIEKLPSSSYKILLSKTVSYTVRFDKTTDTVVRPEVFTTLSKYIPETFIDNQFDWKIDTDKEIEAIVIVGDTYKALKKVRAKYPNIRLETQSIASLLVEMKKEPSDNEIDPDVFIYAAKKGRERGGDNIVLNVEVTEEEPSPTSESTPNKPQSHTLQIVAVIFLVFISATTMFWNLRRGASSITTPSPSPNIVFASPSPSQTSMVALTDYKILVLNGTKTNGLATTYQTKFIDQGFTNVQTGNASEASISTKIYAQNPLPDSLQKSLLTILSPYTPEIIIGPIDNLSSTNDIVIVLGTK